MTWNWQQPDWPDFHLRSKGFGASGAAVPAVNPGEFVGACKHIGADDQESAQDRADQRRGGQDLRDRRRNPRPRQRPVLPAPPIRAWRRSARRDARRARHRRDDGRSLPQLRGAARRQDDVRLAHDAAGADDRDIKVIGGYRTHAEPMQVVSGPDPQAHGAFRGAAFRARARRR